MNKNKFNPDYGNDPKVLHGVISDQNETIATLTQKLKTEEELYENAVREMDNTIKINIKLTQKLEDLEGVLEKIAKHNPGCNSFKQHRRTMGMGLDKEPCSCGLEQTLKKGKG